jgi:hypothetical protein
MGRNNNYNEDDVYWSEYHRAYIHHEDAIKVESGDYYYDGDGSIASAISVDDEYVLVDECEEVRAFDADEFSGMTDIDDVSTSRYYKTPNGDFLKYSVTPVYDVWVIDGDIKGRIL